MEFLSKLYLFLSLRSRFYTRKFAQMDPNGTYPNQKPASISRFFMFFLGPELCFSERHSNWAALAPDGNCGRTCNIGVMVGLGKPATFVFVSQKSSAFSASLVPCVRGNQIVQNLAPHTQISTFGLYVTFLQILKY